MTSETADLQTEVWGAWRQDLAHVQRAAEVVREGAGRLGQHRRQVRDTSAELTTFAARWRPAVPDLATDPAELADQVMWLHGRRVEDSINAFVAREVADAHRVTPAQVVLRWHLDSGVVVIPKSATPERIRANLDITGFRLTDEEKSRLDGLAGS